MNLNLIERNNNFKIGLIKINMITIWLLNSIKFVKKNVIIWKNK